MLPLHFPKLKAAKLPAALSALEKSGLSRALASFDPILAGTIPLGLELKDSDLDICCRFGTPSAWNVLIDFLKTFPAFAQKEKVFSSGPATLIYLRLDDWPVEIIFQQIPVYQQMAVRHLWVEAQFLYKYGEHFQEKVRAVRTLGYKTEPAFARVLALPGDPYQALLTLEREFDPICVS